MMRLSRYMPHIPSAQVEASKMNPSLSAIFRCEDRCWENHFAQATYFSSCYCLQTCGWQQLVAMSEMSTESGQLDRFEQQRIDTFSLGFAFPFSESISYISSVLYILYSTVQRSRFFLVIVQESRDNMVPENHHRDFR